MFLKKGNSLGFLDFFFFFTIPNSKRNFPDQELNLCLLQEKHGVLTTRPPGKSRKKFFVSKYRITFWTSWYIFFLVYILP